jgi:hypothetical protein
VLQAGRSQGPFPMGSLGFFIDLILLGMLCSELVVDSASTTNEYQEYLLSGKGGQCVRLTTLPPSCANYLEILGASTSYSPQSVLACNGIAFTLSQLTLTAVTVPIALYNAFLLL